MLHRRAERGHRYAKLLRGVCCHPNSNLGDHKRTSSKAAVQNAAEFQTVPPTAQRTPSEGGKARERAERRELSNGRLVERDGRGVLLQQVRIIPQRQRTTQKEQNRLRTDVPPNKSLECFAADNVRNKQGASENQTGSVFTLYTRSERRPVVR